VTPQVCASATVTISVPAAGDQDGDGDPDNTDPQPTNPCVWVQVKSYRIRQRHGVLQTVMAMV
jgi:hypothetical protein